MVVAARLFDKVLVRHFGGVDGLDLGVAGGAYVNIARDLRSFRHRFGGHNLIDIEVVGEIKRRLVRHSQILGHLTFGIGAVGLLASIRRHDGVDDAMNDAAMCGEL